MSHAQRFALGTAYFWGSRARGRSVLRADRVAWWIAYPAHPLGQRDGANPSHSRSLSPLGHTADKGTSMTRWALVTAGAQGLGAALSRHLLEQGYGVVVHYYS